LLSEGSETSFCLGRLLNSYSAQSRVDQAGELCLRHAELISADAGLNFLSGKIFMQLGLTRKAFEYLSKAIALEPSLDGAEMELLFLADHGKFLSEVDVLRVRLRYGIND
jgi:tetratricopeptide (TPR) repeat protein